MKEYVHRSIIILATILNCNISWRKKIAGLRVFDFANKEINVILPVQNFENSIQIFEILYPRNLIPLTYLNKRLLSNV